MDMEFIAEGFRPVVGFLIWYSENIWKEGMSNRSYLFWELCISLSTMSLTTTRTSSTTSSTASTPNMPLQKPTQAVSSSQYSGVTRKSYEDYEREENLLTNDGPRKLSTLNKKALFILIIGILLLIVLVNAYTAGSRWEIVIPIQPPPTLQADTAYRPLHSSFQLADPSGFLQSIHVPGTVHNIEALQSAMFTIYTAASIPSSPQFPGINIPTASTSVPTSAFTTSPTSIPTSAPTSASAMSSTRTSASTTSPQNLGLTLPRLSRVIDSASTNPRALQTLGLGLSTSATLSPTHEVLCLSKSNSPLPNPSNAASQTVQRDSI